jgi:signal transduction histidine kinase
MSSIASPSLGPSRWQRSLLPAVLLGGFDPAADAAPGRRPRRSARDWLVDVGMFVLALGVGLVANTTDWPQHGALFHAFDVVLGVVSLAALWVRRSHPVTVAAFTAVVSVVSVLSGGAALLALFTVAVHCRPRVLAAMAALSAVTIAIYPAVSPGKDGGSYGWLDLWMGLLLTAIVIAWGLFVAARRQLVLSLYERARRLESEQRLRIEQARQAERARIAREMHDVLAHRVSLLSVHAGALEFRPDAPAEEIARAAAVIRSSAHDALQELRDVIGVLRADEHDEALERPQPTLARLPALVEESRAAGMEVRLSVEPDADDRVPDALGRTVYRIVQEGLTNARKHAAGAVVDVTIGGGRRAGVRVEVLTRAPVGRGGTAMPAAGTLPGAGTGLVGLAERVSLAGGTLSHGPTADGGFLLRATLPWPS